MKRVIRIRIAALLFILCCASAFSIPTSAVPAKEASKGETGVKGTGSGEAVDQMLTRILQAFDKAQRETTTLVASFFSGTVFQSCGVAELGVSGGALPPSR